MKSDVTDTLTELVRIEFIDTDEVERAVDFYRCFMLEYGQG